jgi:CHAT domain-containing protein
MTRFVDPLQTVEVTLPAGWAYDPLSSSLTGLVFARWDRPDETLTVNLRPARVPAAAGEDAWLASLQAETGGRPLLDLRSPEGPAVAVDLTGEGQGPWRRAMVRGARADLVLVHRGADVAAADPWAPLRTAVGSAGSAQNRSLPRYRQESELRQAFAAAQAAVEAGDAQTAHAAVADALEVARSTWHASLLDAHRPPEVPAALRAAEVLAFLGHVLGLPPFLRDAEHLTRRALDTLASLQPLPPSAARVGAEAEQTLAEIMAAQRRLIAAEQDVQLTTTGALHRRAAWLADAARTAMSQGQVALAARHAAVGVADALSLLMLLRRNPVPAGEVPDGVDRDAHARAVAVATESLVVRPLAAAAQVAYLAAMDRQDADDARAATAVLVPAARFLADHLDDPDGVLARNLAIALMAEAGLVLFAADDPQLAASAAALAEATAALDHAGEEGELRAQLCLNDAWLRHQRREVDGALAVVERGMAAARRAEADRLLRSLQSLASQFLLHEGRLDEAVAAGRAAVEGLRTPISSNLLNLAIVEHAAGAQSSALDRLRAGLAIALADNPLGDDVLRLLFVAAAYAGDVDVRTGLELTWAAQALIDARRSRVGDAPERIAFDEAVHHREVAGTLVSRLLAADDFLAALEVADRSRAQTLRDLLGEPAAPTPPASAFAPAPDLDEPSAVEALMTAAVHVRAEAAAALEAIGLEPALTGRQLVDVVANSGRSALVLHPVGERVHLLLVRPDGGLVVGESALALRDLREHVGQAQAELGTFAVARARSGDRLPLADVDTDEKALDLAVEALSSALLGEIAALVPPGGLTIVPYRELALVPFALLHHPDGGLLLERHDLAVVPSLATLAGLRTRGAAPARGCLVYGDPSTDAGSGLEPLPHAAAEAHAVAQLLTSSGVAPSRIALRVHADASEEAYRSDAPVSGLIHLACHAMVAEPASRSALFLAAGPVDDGHLLPREIAEIHVGGALVFLAACQTGLGRPTADGVLGLGRGFLEAGARAVVMSLWRVADVATRVFVEHFYRALLGLDGDAPADAAAALRVAVLGTRDDLAAGVVRTERHEVLDDHPAHWAPFLLVGDAGARGPATEDEL